MRIKATPLFPTFEKRISDDVDALINAQVTPWIFFETGSPFRVNRLVGSEISYQGISYAGSPQDVFWSRYIEPFLEVMIDDALKDAVRTCKEREIDARRALPELQGILLSGCGQVYSRMAEVDRRLRGHGYPDSVATRSIMHELGEMETYLQTRVNAELEMWRPRILEKWYKHNKFWVWIIGILFTVASIGVPVWLALRAKPQPIDTNAVDPPPVQHKTEVPTSEMQRPVRHP